MNANNFCFVGFDLSTPVVCDPKAKTGNPLGTQQELGLSTSLLCIVSVLTFSPSLNTDFYACKVQKFNKHIFDSGWSSSTPKGWMV